MRRKPESKQAAMAVLQSTRRLRRRMTLFIVASIQTERSLVGVLRCSLRNSCAARELPAMRGLLLHSSFRIYCSDVGHPLV